MAITAMVGPPTYPAPMQVIFFAHTVSAFARIFKKGFVEILCVFAVGLEKN